MRVLLTGANGRVGRAIRSELADRPEYEFIHLDRRDDPTGETFVADIANYEAIRPAFDDQDAIVHLAAFPTTSGSWEEVHRSNLVGMHNVLEAARDAGVESFVFASSIHAVGMYEVNNEPGVYDIDHELTVDHTSPIRPDSYYGASKAFGEHWGRYYVECESFPERFYSIRIASVREEPYNHPYGDAECGVDDGSFERGSHEYETQVDRLKGTWLSHRDLGQIVDRCLQDDTVEFDVFYGTSDNPRGWFDLRHAREVLGYDPRDSGEDWDAPPQ